MGKLKFEFSLSISTQFDFYLEIFTELPYSSSSASSSGSPIMLSIHSYAGLSMYAVYGRRSHKMKQTQTHVWSLAGEEAVS